MISKNLWQLGGTLTSDFILHPSQHLGAGWEQALLPPNINVGSMSTRAQLFVSRHLSARLALSVEAPPADTDRLSWAIALLPQQRLERFCCHLGATLAAQEVRYIIERDAVKAYRQTLGDDLFWFVMQRTPLIYRLSDTEQHCWGPEAIMDAVRAAGGQALRRMVESRSTDLWRRLQLKLPYPPPPDDIPADPSASNVESLRRLTLRILRETETTWTHQFMTNTEADSPETAS